MKPCIQTNRTERDVILFFVNNGLYSNEIEGDTIINKKGYDYWDMVELLEEFFTHFDIKNPEEFNVKKYLYRFNFCSFMRKVFFIERDKKENFIIPITVSHMIEVAKRKEWFEPE